LAAGLDGRALAAGALTPGPAGANISEHDRFSGSQTSDRMPTQPNRKPLNDKVFHVLLALANEDLHGYAIKQDVEARTGGVVKMGPGTLYETLQRAERRGLIAEVEDRSGATEDHSQRRYYRLTELGRSSLESEVRRLAEIVDTAKARVLTEGKGRA
jgi:DNA-binding PadR family transcriptional regulator